MQAKLVAGENGPEPFCALRYKKKEEPKERKMALMIEGCEKSLKGRLSGHMGLTAASMYFPDNISSSVAVYTVCERARLASLIPKLAHL